MPKPFRRAPGQVVHVSPSAVARRPALAIGIANIASHWSTLEQTISMPHTLLLAGQEQSAFEAYHELFDINLRHKMFLAVARHKRVSKELIKESETLHQKVRKTAGSRNRVVHGTWAYCDDLPDSLLLCEPSSVNRKVNEFFSQFHDKADDFATGQSTGSWSFDLSIDEYEEYQHNDLNEITARIIALDALATAYWRKIAAFSIQTERERRARRAKR